LKKYKFIRFGGLSSVPQKGYDANTPTFHSPPARRGIYAAPYDRLEHFIIPLISVRNKKTKRETLHPSIEYLRDSKGNKVLLNWEQRLGRVELPEEIQKLYYNPHYDPKSLWSDKYKNYVHSYTFWKGNTNSEDYKFEEENFKHEALLKYKKPKVFEYNGNLWCHLNCYVPIKRKDIIKERGDWLLLDFNSWLKYYTYAKEHNKYKDYGNRTHKNYSWDYFEVFIEKV